jgi:hypothetical protein
VNDREYRTLIGQRHLLAAVRRHAGASVADLSTATGWTQAKVRRVAGQLVASGDLTATKRRRFDSQAAAMPGCHSRLFGGAGVMVRTFWTYTANGGK